MVEFMVAEVDWSAAALQSIRLPHLSAETAAVVRI